MDGVPVLGGDHGHAGDGEILVEAVEGSAGPAATTAHHSGRGLEGVGGGLHVEHAVQQGAQAGIGPGIVDGRAHHQTVGLTHAFDAFVDRVVLEDAKAGLGTFAAGDTAADGLVAHVKRGGLDTGLFQLLGHSVIHINVHVPENIPAYDRIRAFEETCREYHVPYELNLNVSGDSYQELFEQMRVIFQDIDSKYSGQKKGIFLSNDTYANIFLNLIFQKYNCLPDEYQIIGFDNSPIAAESIIPITTIGQQIDVIAQTTMELLVEQMNEMKKRKPAPLQKPIHKKITPVLIRRQTTGE